MCAYTDLSVIFKGFLYKGRYKCISKNKIKCATYFIYLFLYKKAQCPALVSLTTGCQVNN